MTTPVRVALLAGRRRSLASLLMLATLARLRPKHVEIAAVLSVSEFRWSRLRDWYLRFGVGALTKGLREIGITAGGIDDEQVVLRDEMSRRSVDARSLPELCRLCEIPFYLVSDINGREALTRLETCRCEYGVYSGAGILRPPLLDRFPSGVLNLHCGSLPEIRGMNGVEWNLFFGRPPEATLHMIDAGIDTGPILASRIVDILPGDTLGRLRGKTIVAGIDLMAEVLPKIRSYPRRANPARDGRQYFAMAETLKGVIEDRLRRRSADGDTGSVGGERGPLCKSDETRGLQRCRAA